MENYPYESLAWSHAEPTWRAWFFVIVVTALMAIFLLNSMPPIVGSSSYVLSVILAIPAIILLILRGQYFYWLSSVAWLGRGYASHFLSVPKGWRTNHSLTHSSSPAVIAVLASVQYGDRPDRVRTFVWWGATLMIFAATLPAWHAATDWPGYIVLFASATALIYALRRAGLESWALMLIAINCNSSLRSKLVLLPVAISLQVATFPAIPLSEDRFYFWKIYSGRVFSIPMTP